MSEAPGQDARDLLREVVKGADDDALVRFAENLGGIEAFLDLTFEGMKAALVPERAQDCVIGWRITRGADEYPYRVSIEGGQLTWERGDPADARVTLRLSLPNYMRLIAGELDGMQAFMSGALQLMGDMMFAAQIQQMFGLAPSVPGAG